MYSEISDSIPKDFTHERELEFLKSIRGNKKALEGYIASANSRVNWGYIKKFDAVLYAKILLGSL